MLLYVAWYIFPERVLWTLLQWGTMEHKKLPYWDDTRWQLANFSPNANSKKKWKNDVHLNFPMQLLPQPSYELSPIASTFPPMDKERSFFVIENCRGRELYRCFLWKVSIQKIGVMKQRNYSTFLVLFHETLNTRKKKK